MSPLARYLHLTRQVMPREARARGWPVHLDHCFQRIVLDHVCGGRWYDHIKRPAVKHMSDAQAREAAAICDRILAGEADLHAMNAQSLAWRGKTRRLARGDAQLSLDLCQSAPTPRTPPA
ncbi:MAG: hypothetical protein AAFP13_01305 [Pseudomonadota bacterium]